MFISRILTLSLFSRYLAVNPSDAAKAGETSQQNSNNKKQ
jgi:hypothetical protein